MFASLPSPAPHPHRGGDPNMVLGLRISALKDEDIVQRLMKIKRSRMLVVDYLFKKSLRVPDTTRIKNTSHDFNEKKKKLKKENNPVHFTSSRFSYFEYTSLGVSRTHILSILLRHFALFDAVPIQRTHTNVPTHYIPTVTTPTSITSYLRIVSRYFITRKNLQFYLNVSVPYNPHVAAASLSPLSLPKKKKVK